MAVLTAARFITITDALAAVMLAAKGASGNGLGTNATEEPSDDIGARGRLGDLNAAILAFAEDDYLGLLSGIRASVEKAGYETWAADVLEDAVEALDDLCADAGLTGVTNITSFASYYNTGSGGAYSALVAPDFGRGVYYHVNGQNMVATNVYSPAIADMGNRAVAGSYVDGDEVDTDKYAGAARLLVTIPDLTGSGLVVVTGNGRSAAGATVTGRTWTVEVTSTAATALVPSVAGDICTDVTGITLGAGITAGTATVSCAIPAGRANPPT